MSHQSKFPDTSDISNFDDGQDNNETIGDILKYSKFENNNMR